MAILIPLILIFLLIVLVFYWLVKRQYSYWENLNIPYVPSNMPFGNLKEVGKKEHLYDRLAKYYNQYKTKYPLIGIHFFLRPVALILDQDLLKNILIKDANNFNDRGIYYNEKNDPLSAHLFAIHGPKWRLLRSNLTPTFTSGKMKFMFSTITEVGERLRSKLLNEIKLNDEFEIKDIFARYTTDVIGSCAFGIECNTLNDKNAKFREMSIKIFDNPKYNFSIMLLLASIRNFAKKLGIKSLRDDVTNFFSSVLNETITYRKHNNVTRNDFLNLLIELKEKTANTENPLELNDLYAQSFLFFAAGFETSSTLLTFCFYELAKNPDIQKKARNHIDEILKKHNNILTYEAMMDMKYLEQILNESLRKYSPVSTLFRVAENDYKVQDTNYILKKGTMVAIPAIAIHNDKNFYPNADRFDPEHFSEENVKSRPSTAFLPFGEGPRNCIGARFGMMQAKIGAIEALRNFEYSLSNKCGSVKISPNHFITSPIGGIWLKVKLVKE